MTSRPRVVANPLSAVPTPNPQHQHIVELDGRPLFLTGPNATWRDKLQLTDGQIHHALFCTIPRGELLAVLANANWTPESMRSEITVAKYRELDDRLLPEASAMCAGLPAVKQ